MYFLDWCAYYVVLRKIQKGNYNKHCKISMCGKQLLCWLGIGFYQSEESLNLTPCFLNSLTKYLQLFNIY